MLSGPGVGSRGVLSEDLVNLQAWEGPVLLASRCGLFSAPALPVVVVPPVHLSASPLRSVCVCVCLCVTPLPSTSRVIISITLASQIKTLLPSRRWGKRSRRVLCPNHSKCIASPALAPGGKLPQNPPPSSFAMSNGRMLGNKACKLNLFLCGVAEHLPDFHM